MIFRYFLVAAVAVLLAASPLAPALISPAAAVQPDEMLENPVLERRARAISKDLRCVVCQNESIDESNAELARDMRVIVRQRLLAGDSDGQVIEFMVDRYGDYVLLRPPLKATTYALWFGPAIFVMIAAFAGWRYYRRQNAEFAAAKAGPAAPVATAILEAEEPPPPPLTAEEKRRFEKLLKETDGAGGSA